MSHWWYKEKVPQLFRVMQSRYYKYAAVSMLLGHLIISRLSRRSLDLPFIPKKVLDTRILEQSFCLVLMLISGVTLSPNRNLMNLRVYRWVGFDFINSLLYRSNSRPSRQSHKSMQRRGVRFAKAPARRRKITFYLRYFYYWHSEGYCAIRPCHVVSKLLSMANRFSSVLCHRHPLFLPSHLIIFSKIHALYCMVRRRPQLRARREVFSTINQEQPL